MPYKLTSFEKETILRTSEGDDVWEIFTFNPRLKRLLAEFAAAYPERCRMIEEQADVGSQTWKIGKNDLTVKPKAPMSEEQRQKRREQLAKLRAAGKI